MSKKKTPVDRFFTQLRELREAIRDDERFAEDPGFPLANFFKKTITAHGMIFTEASWKKTKDTAHALAVREDFEESIWKEAVVWAFSDEKKADKFWGRVTINHLGTIVKMFNTFITCREAAGRCGETRKFHVEY